jgi:1,4-dihydroxy-6-naphthoate synthase
MKLAYSPCPNDTYIFAALTNGLLPDAPKVEAVLDDIESLNAAARRAQYELTKISYGAIPYLTDRYRILRSGGALGRGCGPLLIARPKRDGSVPELEALDPEALIAIPGVMTTAFLLLRLALRRTPQYAEMRFDRIVDAVSSGEVDAGLIIHESRFTYQQRGLRPIVDLGEWWERDSGAAIPLGAILARRDLEDATAKNIDASIRRSLEFARTREAAVMDYVRAHAAEMSDEVMRKHIALYVNDYSDEIGEDGTRAVEMLFARASAAGLIPNDAKPEFVG